MAASNDATKKQLKAVKKGSVLKSAEATDIEKMDSALKAVGQILEIMQSNPFKNPSNHARVSQLTESLEGLQAYQATRKQELLTTQPVNSPEDGDAFIQSFAAHVSNIASADRKKNGENTSFMDMAREETAANVASKKQIKKMNDSLKGALLLDINTKQKLAQVNEQLLAYTTRHNSKSNDDVTDALMQPYIRTRDLKGLKNLEEKLIANKKKIETLNGLNCRNNLALALYLNLLLSGFLTGTLPEDAHLYMCIPIIVYIEQNHAQKVKIIGLSQNALDPILREPYGNKVLTCAIELLDIILALKKAFNFNPIFATYLIRCKSYLNPKALTADSLLASSEPVNDAEQRQMVVASNQAYFDYVNNQYLTSKKKDMQQKFEALLSRHNVSGTDPSKLQQLKAFDTLQKENEINFKSAQLMNCLDGFIYIYKEFELKCDALHEKLLKSLEIIEELYVSSKATAASKPLIEVINDYDDKPKEKTHEEQVELDKKLAKEIEAKQRDERSAAILTQQQNEAAKAKAQRDAEDERSALMVVKKETLERIKTLDNKEYNLLLKIVNATGLHNSVDEPLFLKLSTKLNALKPTSNGYEFRLGDKVKSADRVHAGDKVNAEFLKDVSDILNHFELTETDIAEMRKSAGATATAAAKP